MQRPNRITEASSLPNAYTLKTARQKPKDRDKERRTKGIAQSQYPSPAFKSLKVRL